MTTTLYAVDEKPREYVAYTPPPAPIPTPRGVRSIPNAMPVSNRQALQLGGFVAIFAWPLIIAALVIGGWLAAVHVNSAAPQPPSETSNVQDKAPANSGQRQQPADTSGGLECIVTNPHATTAVRPAACR